MLVLGFEVRHYLVLADAGCAQSVIQLGLDLLKSVPQSLDPTKAPHESGQAEEYGNVRKEIDELDMLENPCCFWTASLYARSCNTHKRPSESRQNNCCFDLGREGERQRFSEEAGPACVVSASKRGAWEGVGVGERKEGEGGRRGGGESRTVFAKLATERPCGERHTS